MFRNGSQELRGGAANALSIGGAVHEPRGFSAQQSQENSGAIDFFMGGFSVASLALRQHAGQYSAMNGGESLRFTLQREINRELGAK